MELARLALDPHDGQHADDRHAAGLEHVDDRPVQIAAAEPLADHHGHVVQVRRQAVVEVDHARVDPSGEAVRGGGRSGQLDGHR